MKDRLPTKDNLIIGDVGNCGWRCCQWRFVRNSRGLEPLEQFSEEECLDKGWGFAGLQQFGLYGRARI
jgi:hypothetical protein